MPNFTIRPYNSSDEEQVIDLWRECGLVVPQNDPKRDIEAKMHFQPDLFLIGTIGDRIVATAMVGYEGHRGWINYLAVTPELRRNGLGRKIMDEAEIRLRKLGCQKINLQVRTSNLAVQAFYERLGFAVDNVVSMGKRLK